MPEWYEKWFGLDYLRLYARRDEDEASRQLAFAREIVPDLRPPARVLDLACGAGRHALLLAARGYRVVGTDLSAELLAEASLDRCRRGLRLALVRSDMRRLPFRPVFDMVVNFFTSFGYFQEDRQNGMILDAIGASMKPGGAFLIDYLNPDHVRTHLVPESEEDLPGGGRVRIRRWVDERTRRVEKEIRLERPGQDPQRFRESVRLYSPRHMQEMIERRGLSVCAMYGDFDREAVYTPDRSPRMILSGRKPDPGAGRKSAAGAGGGRNR